MNERDWSEEVSIPLPNGTVITMRRDDEGLTVCHDSACLSLPATAPQFLALLEFFQTLGSSLPEEKDAGN